ncbi:hypothetical protein ACSIMU_003966 [Yersinia enterocolitica]|uniref:hypothetical protein n=1 Tax=Yersinia enterocolitica TaxID=630 RepID=UPI001F576FF1|nr:hypothetical protein [Yersinia enterocolitica]EKN6043745.1 hypothetical protein [Yersinia enterocolitica]EKN6246908.1 hypothetical protein [Yersinia enterocolitica]EKN6276840.1 hypothetical protein [Yersinia enterocolitica]EKN6388752.1 hypothetical protein [Yersinia enterocolitica]ELI8358025.1 hypothetical protein [Yersinia enterocolitica]
MDDISELILTVARAPGDGRDHKDCYLWDMRIRQRLRNGDKSKRPLPRQVVPPTPVKMAKSVKAKMRKIMEAA